MKRKLIAIILVLSMLFTGNAFALNYKMHSENPATFETLEEAHTNSATYLSASTGWIFVPDPALDTYPAGTSYVYRSAGLYTPLTAAPRMNTNFLVYTDAEIADKDAAKKYIDDLGLTDIVDKCTGTVVLVTPINRETGFGMDDQYAFYQLQSAMCNVGYATGDQFTAAKERVRYADNSYIGGLTYRYAIGIGGGATFLNNYVAGSIDFVSRLAGMLLVGGSMENVRSVASCVPVYMVNPTDLSVEKYKAANGTDAWGRNGDVDYYYNQALPLRKVYVERMETIDLKQLIAKVYDELFIKVMRNAVYRKGLYTAGTQYNHYNWNQAPYSLAERNAFYTGKTAGGLTVIERYEDRFSDICTETGEFIQTWYEILPDEVLDGTAAPGSIPLVLANHGGGDDTMQFIDEFGILALAEDERFAIVAPYHADTTYSNDRCLPALVRYMLETYPALDASRVYTTGYSMGGMASMAAAYGAPELFAACVPMAFPFWKATDEENAACAKYGMPFLAVISTYDDYWYDWGIGVKTNYQTYINSFMQFNGMDSIEYDFEKYPMSGFRGDLYECKVLGGEYVNHNWLCLNKDGIPMVGLNATEDLPHGLWQEYAGIAWNFAKHYSRNLETGMIEYHADVK